MILVGEGDAADAKRRLLERAGATVVSEFDQAALAIVAIEDDGEALAATMRLKARGILVNAVDRVALCDFTLPAIVDRDPVLIAIGSGGASAGLAKALRQRLEAILPQSLGALAKALLDARAALRAKYPDSTDRRQAIDGALADGGLLDPFADSHGVANWLAGGTTDSTDGVKTIVLTSFDPDDLTLRQARLLASASLICHAPDVPAVILDRARADATRVCGGTPAELIAGLTLIVSMAP